MEKHYEDSVLTPASSLFCQRSPAYEVLQCPNLRRCHLRKCSALPGRGMTCWNKASCLHHQFIQTNGMNCFHRSCYVTSLTSAIPTFYKPIIKHNHVNAKIALFYIAWPVCCYWGRSSLTWVGGEDWLGQLYSVISLTLASQASYARPNFANTWSHRRRNARQHAGN